MAGRRVRAKRCRTLTDQIIGDAEWGLLVHRREAGEDLKCMAAEVGLTLPTLTAHLRIDAVRIHASEDRTRRLRARAGFDA